MIIKIYYIKKLFNYLLNLINLPILNYNPIFNQKLSKLYYL